MTMIVMMFLSKTSKLRTVTMIVTLPLNQVPGLGEQLEKIQSELSLCEKVKI